MASILDQVSTGKRGRAQRVVIYAPEGFGKSTIASRFPSPLFLDVEDSTSQLDVRRLTREQLPNQKAFEAAILAVAKERPCQTLIVDTVDWLEVIVTEAMIADANNPKITGIEDFGYGKGFTALRERMQTILSRLDTVIHAGISVVLLAHAKVAKFEPPDGAGPYDRYELKLSKQVAPVVKEWADMLLFGNWRTQVREKDRNEAGAQFKGVGGKERLLYCNRSASWDAKNRHGMGDTEKWDIATIEKAFREAAAPWGEVPVPSADPLNAPTEEDDYAAICAPHAVPITQHLLARGEITPEQDWRHVSPQFRARVLRNPKGFLKLALESRITPPVTTP